MAVEPDPAIPGRTSCGEAGNPAKAPDELPDDETQVIDGQAAPGAGGAVLAGFCAAQRSHWRWDPAAR